MSYFVIIKIYLQSNTFFNFDPNGLYRRYWLGPKMIVLLNYKSQKILCSYAYYCVYALHFSLVRSEQTVFIFGNEFTDVTGFSFNQGLIT